MQTVAILGLGRMGQGIALRLLQSGFRVVVWNRTREKAASLLSQGAVWAESPAVAARGAFAVLAMVADDTASAALWFGEIEENERQGAAATGGKEGALYSMEAGAL